MDAKIEYLGGARFSASVRGHSVISDQPFESGGSDSAMSPPELLLASLGTCAGYYAVEYLRARQLPVDGLKLTVTADKGSQPARFSNFCVTVSVGGIEKRHVEGLLRAVKACMVHHTLQHQPQITFVASVDDSCAALSVAPKAGGLTNVPV